MGQVEDDRLTHAITFGGLADSETIEMTTRPERSAPTPGGDHAHIVDDQAHGCTKQRRALVACHVGVVERLG
jgi:hypothetical protein